MKSRMDRGLNLLDFATTQIKMVECPVGQKISANNHMLSYIPLSTSLLQCNYDVRFVGMEDFPEFYIFALRAWSEITNTTSKITGWFILVNKNYFYYKKFHEGGITFIRDLLDENQKLTSKA